ncbi:MAG: hypothetical protein M3P43_13330 [Actinomycetota bacterium]|nr:hypothetical protein [Actinomycetota bacterium]
MNYRKTRRRITALLAWMRAESGNELNDGTHPGGGAAYNPLGSTYPYDYPKYNEVGVRNYPDFASGVLATLETLDLPDHNYEPIIAALQAAKIMDVSLAVAASEWGTGMGVLNTISYTKDYYRQEYLRPVGIP